MNVRTLMEDILTTDQLITLTLIRSKSIKDQLPEINKSIKKLVNNVKKKLAIVCLNLL